MSHMPIVSAAHLFVALAFFSMNEHKNQRLTTYSRELRSNMTKEERHLWYDFLKNLPVTFHRQKVFGQYILDFYCASAGISIELDGSQHFSEEGEQKDGLRDCYCAERGVKVLRYSNLQIAEDFEGVCQDILREIEERRGT